MYNYILFSVLQNKYINIIYWVITAVYVKFDLLVNTLTEICDVYNIFHLYLPHK